MITFYHLFHLLCYHYERSVVIDGRCLCVCVCVCVCILAKCAGVAVCARANRGQQRRKRPVCAGTNSEKPRLW